MFGEWLLTNGIGGFACGSISGVPKRKYHSMLNAALPNPNGRVNMLNYVSETIILLDKTEVPLSNLKTKDNLNNNELSNIEAFQIENGLPVWTYNIDGIRIEKCLLLIRHQNTFCAFYKLLSSHEGISLRWRPYFQFRAMERPVDSASPDEVYNIHAENGKFEIQCPSFPTLRIYNFSQAAFSITPEKVENVFYEIEAARGYPSLGTLNSPGFFQTSLILDERVAFIASTETWETIFVISPMEALALERIRKKNLLRNAGFNGKPSMASKLILAADQFIITPQTRFENMVRLQALGEEARTIIAGYPWFTDWGRDTMISLEGLTLVTGRSKDAYAILHTFAYYIKNGLIPNMFPDGEHQGIYNTADATLWFFHATSRYIEITGDEDILEFLLPKLTEVIQFHLKGTKFGIKMDGDGLLIQGQQGLQLTWMDAKVDDWVVTPRRGKAVEINALWYNALKLYEKWADLSSELSELCYDSFNKKFWIEQKQYLYDVIEGENSDDSALRPNQLFAISLEHPVLKPDHWKPVFDIVEEELLTPFGLRTLSPKHPDYKPTYDGDLRSRDAAYHQGTVWPWLIGAYIDASLKVYPDSLDHPLEILHSFESHFENTCFGNVSEIFDAHFPYAARGCFAQAWSVAELLRS
jgi:predicted glycogen debranching enzyme